MQQAISLSLARGNSPPSSGLRGWCSVSEAITSPIDCFILHFMWLQRASPCLSAYGTFSLRCEKEHLFERGFIIFYYFFFFKKDIKEPNVAFFVERLGTGAPESWQWSAGCAHKPVGLERALRSAIHHGDIWLPVSSFRLSEVRVWLCGVAACVFVCIA